ncbi:UDP-N-acetylmuramoyl-tripeptide--D-alanyl-D-alanine ligase [Natranaerofaba carboxydovora]|uniref:UDP-N-acetylmuramoyl-tripeptide--D-alanyl-D- alanine ligase n=1 Tax=Natranaerofaba carboxydovora TaxID=2742683 RepID=UPI001F143C87|nr:UDP-N-acetylmuramoyl-tripeptide--D-alanyl-D-alanine ligase [Natranaerofaba carboxydovora]UMZ73254.1 UDP-N-acetylmuramoyl-tripeptide--D-alanyl-D-alanine ligase [Natranaerofaba carboxydovora]
MWTLNKLADYSGGKLINGYGEIEVKGFSIDSRMVKDGDLFIALKGERTDGHYFLKDALKKGASACLVENEKYNQEDLETGQAIIEVNNSLEALKMIAMKHREQYNVKVIGITGSVGKTTTKDMVAEVLRQNYKVLKTEGNLNTGIGLPLTLLNLNELHEVIVLEMGMRQMGEIAELCRIARPDIGIITNVAESHLENLKTIENIAKAKGELLEGLANDGVAIINGDDERVVRLQSKAPNRVVSYGTGVDANLVIKDIKPRQERIECLLEHRPKGEENEKVKMSLNFPGKHNLMNAMAALLAGVELNVSLTKGVENLKNFYPTDMRNQIFTGKKDITVINDTYNANVKSTKAALDILSDVATNRKVAILGDMYELGDYTDDAHLEVGEYVASKEVEVIIAVGDKAKLIKDGALNAGLNNDNVLFYNNKEELIKQIQGILKPGDTILVKGSRGMALEDVVYAIIDEEG